MKIIKFGGTSLSTPDGLTKVRNILDRSGPAVVVVSAFAHATDQLVEMCSIASKGDSTYLERYEAFASRHREMVAANISSSERPAVEERIETLLSDLKDVLHGIFLVRDVSLKTLDFVMAFGERLSALIVAEALRPRFKDCRAVDARDVIKTNGAFGSASVLREKTAELLREAFRGKQGIAIVTGFIASTEQNETTTLGRGGSDYTAALLASALGAEEIVYYTTVDGMLTADPKKVSRAFTISQLTYDEALELGHFGTKLIFGPALQPALERRIPIRIKNVLNPESPGTLISDAPPSNEFPVTGISSISQISLFQLEGSGLIGVTGTAHRLFDTLSRKGVNVILISQASSEHSICFAVPPQSAVAAAAAVREEFAFEIEAGEIAFYPPETAHSIVAVVGVNMRRARGISGRLFQALGKNGINVVAIAQGSSELNISVVVDRSDESKALNALHDSFFLSDRKTINLYLAGTGQVGRTLLSQISAQRERLSQKKLELRIVGIANSKKMVLDADGIPEQEWDARLKSASSPSRIIDFVTRMRELNLPNSIFIDCSASDDVAASYVAVLGSSISVVTPNKRANSGSYEQYRELKRTARKANVKFFYETNVGAGLPIIGTLHDLIASGDEIVRIEAVLSGTLSYIFNTYRPSLSFSRVVADAKAKGYTEPDPRDDLSGKDVARKLLILAREVGLPLEEDGVEVQSLVPESCRSAKDGEEFLKMLEREDGAFEKLVSDASKRGEVLRYIASIEGGKAQVRLQPVGSDHPFSSLSGSDNIVSFTTKRYFERPLVVKGPGAGTDVTAAGVLADILRVASYLE